jgi:hypothetical protein
MSRSRRLTWLLVLATLVLGGSGHGGGGRLETRAPVVRAEAFGTTPARGEVRRPDSHADYTAASQRNDDARANATPLGRFGAEPTLAHRTIGGFESFANRQRRAAGAVGSRAPPTVTSDLLR